MKSFKQFITEVMPPYTTYMVTDYVKKLASPKPKLPKPVRGKLFRNDSDLSSVKTPKAVANQPRLKENVLGGAYQLARDGLSRVKTTKGPIRAPFIKGQGSVRYDPESKAGKNSSIPYDTKANKTSHAAAVKSLRKINHGIDEVLTPSMGAETYIHDFVHSDNPKFKGKSKKKRIKQALAAYYSAKRKNK